MQVLVVLDKVQVFVCLMQAAGYQWEASVCDFFLFFFLTELYIFFSILSSLLNFCIGFVYLFCYLAAYVSDLNYVPIISSISL